MKHTGDIYTFILKTREELDIKLSQLLSIQTAEKQVDLLNVKEIQRRMFMLEYAATSNRISKTEYYLDRIKVAERETLIQNHTILYCVRFYIDWSTKLN